MRIALLNIWLKEAGGTETWTLTMATALMRAGHEVDVYTPNVGPFAKMFPCPVYDLSNRDTRSKAEADVCLCNHLPCYKAIAPGVPVIYTSHSPLAELDHIEGYPDDLRPYKVCVSEEIRDRRGGWIIRNPIDLDYYKASSPIRSQLDTVMYVGKNGNAAFALDEACQQLGLRFVVSERQRITAEALDDADLVVGIGRGALEAMACGRQVLLADQRGYMGEQLIGSGMVTGAEVEVLMGCNYSGRETGKTFDIDGLVKEFAKFDSKEGERLRRHVVKFHDAQSIADEYMRIADRMIQGERGNGSSSSETADQMVRR